MAVRKKGEGRLTFLICFRKMGYPEKEGGSNFEETMVYY